MIDLLQYLVLGALAGTVAGLLGVGGGIVIVPALLWLLPIEIIDESRMHVAVATSLATIVPTSISSLYKHHQQHNVNWDIVRIVALSLVIGAIVGVTIASLLPRTILQLGFACFEFVVAVSLFAQKNNIPRNEWRLRPFENRFVAFFIGVLSSVLGVGGGTMTVPYLRARGMSIKPAIGTSSACGLPIAIAGALSWLLFADIANLDHGDVNFVYWPAVIAIGFSAVLFAPIGAMLTIKLPINLLRRIFAVLLFVVGLRLLQNTLI